MNPHTELLASEKIRIRGAIDEPLFCVADVASYIGDSNYKRTVKAYAGVYACRAEILDVQGRARPMMFFTEKGLYKYLLQSRLPTAEPFQSYVYDLLIVERRKLVTAAQLEAKIERDARKLAEEREERLKRQHKKELTKARGFQPHEETTFEDYATWCLERLRAEQPLVAPLYLSEQERGVLSLYFCRSHYEAGYADLLDITVEGVNNPQPRVFRQMSK